MRHFAAKRKATLLPATVSDQEADLVSVAGVFLLLQSPLAFARNSSNQTASAETSAVHSPNATHSTPSHYVGGVSSVTIAVVSDGFRIGTQRVRNIRMGLLVPSERCHLIWCVDSVNPFIDLVENIDPIRY